MKTPISYYGGKQNLVATLLPLLGQPHARYVEPFLGGGAVFWAKRPSPLESINDLDERVITFYRVVQTRFDELNDRIQATLHSEAQHRQAGAILRSASGCEVERAWAFWVQTNMSFSHKIFAGFAFSASHNEAGRTSRYKKQITQALSHRIVNVEIFSRDALSVIDLKDAPDTLFYLDPPYVSSDCGHYKGYTRADWESLLHRLARLEGKFILSSYPEPELTDAITAQGWFQDTHRQAVAVTGKRMGKTKTECITTNFVPEHRKQLLLY